MSKNSEIRTIELFIVVHEINLARLKEDLVLTQRGIAGITETIAEDKAKIDKLKGG